MDRIRLNQSRNFMFAAFATLYFVQGVIQAYQLNFLKPHMDSEGIDPDRVAIVASLALLPFVLKWIMGMISDKFSILGLGHRVPYMQIGLVGTALAFLAAFFIDPSADFTLLATMVLAATFAMALFDTTADALAIDVVPPEDHARVQSFMTGGRAAGLIVLSLIFGFVADRFGYQYLFLIIAALMAIPFVMVLRIREPTTRTPAHSFDRSAFRVLLRREYLVFSVFLILAWTAFQGIDGLVTYYMSDVLESTSRTIGWYGTLKGIGMVIGAIGLSYLVSRFGRRTAAVATALAVSVGGLAFSQITSENAIVSGAVLWGIVVGLQWTVYVTLAMGVVDTRIAGSMFAILQTMSNIGIGAGEGIATSLTDNYSFTTIFRGFGVLNLVVIPLILYVTTRFARLYRESDA